MKKFGFAILVALTVWAVLASGLQAWVCFALFAISLPIMVVGKMVRSDFTLIGGVILLLTGFLMSGWMDEFDTIPDLINEGQLGLAVLLGGVIALGVYLTMHRAGYTFFEDPDIPLVIQGRLDEVSVWQVAPQQKLQRHPSLTRTKDEAAEQRLNERTPEREAEVIDFYGSYRGAHFRPDRSAGAYQRGQNVPLAGNVPAERTRR